jgi:hypothetical protein
LQAARSGVSLDDLAARASRGELGDFAIWLEAEARWAQKGVSVDDLTHMTDARWPFDANIGQIGFPLAGAITEPMRTGDGAIYDLLQIYDAPIEGRARSVVADWIGQAASYSDKLTLPTHVVERLRTILVTQYEGEFLPMAVVVGLFPEGFDEEWAEKLNRFANTCFVYGTRYLHSYESFLGSALLAFVNAQHRVGMLRILAEMAQELVFAGLSKIPPELLAPSHFADTSDKSRAISVRLAQGILDINEVRALAEILATLPDMNEYDLRHIIQIAKLWPMPAGTPEMLVLQMLAKMPPENWENAQILLDFLNNLLRGRSSGLADASVWSELKLPRL